MSGREHTDITTTERASTNGVNVLSELDIRILGMIAQGHQIDVIAQRLNFSARTVRRRLREMCDRLGARAPVQVAVWAARSGII